MDLVIKHIDFEYDSETKEWCAFFAWINNYYWQWDSKNNALTNLFSCYFDTKDL
jgi:hypothetical protein